MPWTQIFPDARPAPADGLGQGDGAPPEVGAPHQLRGMAVAPGIAMGTAYIYEAGAYQATQRDITAEDVPGEVDRFELAVQRAERELRKIIITAREKLGEEGCALFSAQIYMLRDPSLYDDVLHLIRTSLLGAGYALQQALDRHRQRLRASGDPAWRDRVGELDDIQNRLLRNLQQEKAVSRIEADRIVIAQNLTAADILLFSRHGIRGCVLDFGGPTSHVTLMARALGVPAVICIRGSSTHIRSGDDVIVDGFSGRVLLNPDEATRTKYRRKQQRYQRMLRERKDLAGLPAETQDGHRIPLRANIEFREELPLLREYGAQGIGLFRTELLFLAEGSSLSEAQQVAIYRETVRFCRPQPVTFRLLDLGGDKVLPMGRREPNPFLGWRGIRILLDKPDLLRPQLRAILRASADGPVRILVPMVSSLEELRAFKQHMADVEAGLRADGHKVGTDVQVGIMVEVPVTALLAERFAREVDFFSIGTNDLTCLTLGVDRGNDLVAKLYQELHPAVLALIAQTVRAAEQAGIPVSLCGEVAGNPRIAPLLVGLGVQELSMSPVYLLDAKRVLRSMTLVEAQELARDALARPDATSVAALLEDWLREHNPKLAEMLEG